MYYWLDIFFIIIILITVIMGLIKGFMRQIIGILAVVAGLYLAVEYYHYVADVIFDMIPHTIASNFLGFLFVFVITLVLGWLIGLSVSKVIKGPIKFFDRVLGGGLGLLKGILICVVVVLALLIFPINKNWLKESQLAPSCLSISRTFVYLFPEGLKEKFRVKYKEILGKAENNEEKV
jgi:membrane protein required for colicin V production